MSLNKLSKLESKLIEKLRQCTHTDIKKGFKLFKKGDAVIDEDNKEENKYLVDVYIDSNNEFYTIRISISEDVNEGECDCESYLKTGSCKHVTAAIIELIHEETDLDIDDIEQLVMTSQPINNSETLPETSGRVIPLFKEEEGPKPWHRFISRPGIVFQQVLVISGYIYGNSKIFNKIKLSAEDKENGSWSFEFKAAESTIFILKSITIDTKLFNTGAPVVIVR